LNLIFGVIDVTWLCYAALVMIGMYGMYYLVQVFGLPYYVAAPFTILLVAGLGALLHWLVIAPLLSAPPINQLLATGGVLFVLQSFATVAFGIDFRNLGIRMPVLKFYEMHFSYSRLLAFAAALIGMLLVYFFMKKTYVGTAIRAIAGPSDHGADGRRYPPALSHHVSPRRGARRSRLLPVGPAVRCPSVCRPVVRADHLPDLRARRLG
jgi:branched-chain amino acid transport system permease protein